MARYALSAKFRAGRSRWPKWSIASPPNTTKLSFCYEAGPCGYGLYRQITMLGHECVVVAPSLVPTRPGDHVKTDRRDAVTQASLFRSGELTPVWVPDDAHEAMRDLCRARQAAMEAVRRARQQVLSFLLRHARVYSNGGHWTRKHRLWLAANCDMALPRPNSMGSSTRGMERSRRIARRGRPGVCCVIIFKVVG